MHSVHDVSRAVQLSPIDNFEERKHVVRYVIQFPPCVCTTNHEEIHARLQEGLSKTRALIPFIGGTIVSCDDDRNSVMLDIGDGRDIDLGCEDLSDPYNKDSAPALINKSLDTAMDIHGYNPMRISPPDLIPEGRLPTPVFAAKITFTDTGILLVAGVHHASCDGAGFAAIMKLWASQIHGVGKTRAPGVSLRMFDRTAITALRSNSIPSIDRYPGLMVVNELPEAHEELPGAETCVFRFSRESLRGLKQTASPDHPSMPWISTHDALSALLWICVSKARRIPIRHDTSDKLVVSMLSVAVDGRNRLSPDVSSEYLGNASLNCPVRLTVESLLSAQWSLYYTAYAIRSALSDFGARSFAETMALIESIPIGCLKRSYSTIRGPDFAITSWAKMGLYEQSWGPHLGKPAHVRAIVDGVMGWAAILPERSDGSLEVMIVLEPQAMERLKKDSVLRIYADLQPA
ncbi:hypothetical protein Q7P36_000429 [Cladosporium allicinum]